MGEENTIQGNSMVSADAQEREAAPEDMDREMSAETESEGITEEELSDAEYAELIGEEDIQEEIKEEAGADMGSEHAITGLPEKKKKRGKKKSRTATATTDGESFGKGSEPEKKTLHNIGGADTLKTGAVSSPSVMKEAQEITAGLLQKMVRAEITGTRTGEGFYKDCIILPSSVESAGYDSRRDRTVVQRTVKTSASGVHTEKENHIVKHPFFHLPEIFRQEPERDGKQRENKEKHQEKHEEQHQEKHQEKYREKYEEKRPEKYRGKQGEKQHEKHQEKGRKIERTDKEQPILHIENREVLPASRQREALLKGAEDIRSYTIHRPCTIIRDMERGGRSFSHAVRSFTAGLNTPEQAGERSLRKYLGTAVDTVDLLAVLGGRAAADIQKARSRSFTESAVNMERALERGRLKQSDLLLPKKELAAKLKKSGLKPYESWSIVKNRRAIHDALVTKEVLLKLKDESPDQKHVFARTKVLGRNVIGISAHESRKQVGILTSDAGKFYNDFKYAGWTRNMIRSYFASQSDPMLRKLNPADMSIRELKALIVNAERYHLSPEQVSVLRVLLLEKKAQKNRAMDKYLTGLGGAFRSLKALGRKGIRLFERVDDVSVEGYRKLATIYHGVRTVKPMVKLAGTAGFAAVRTVGNLPPVAYVRHQAARQLRRGAKAVSSIAAVQAKRAGSAVRSGFSILRKNAGGKVRTTAGASAGLKGAAKAGKTVRSVSQAGMKSAGTAPLLRTAGTTVKSIGSASENVKKGIRRVRRSRPVRLAGFVGSRLRDGAYFVTAPVRAALSGIAHIRAAIRKVLAAVMALIFAVLLIFLLLIMFSAFITTVGNSTGEIIGGVVTDDDLAEHIRHLNERNAERFREAVTLAKEPPRHDADKVDAQGLYPDEAYHGVHLYHYGSPKTPDAADADIYHNDIPGTPPAGYHFYYINADGETIANHTSNTKDIICLTSVMVGNDYDEEVLTAAPALMDLLFDYLNPEPAYTVSPLYHREGSDRFPYDGYTFEGQTYYCTDSALYTAFDAAEADHVQFYDRPKPYSEKGCKTDWDAYDEDRDAWWEERPEYPDYPDYEDYEDEDEWQEALDAYYDAVDAYWEAHSAWSAARPEVSDYRYCPGHEALSCSYGYRDINIYVTVLTKEDAYRAGANGNVLTYRVPKDYACSEWEEVSVPLSIPAELSGVTGQFTRDGGWANPKHREWCDRLYGGDWYSLYGVDTYSEGVSLPTGEGALTQEQIDEMIARIGDVSEAREQIISFALDYVGRIPYYWGGKASVPGFEGNHFGSIVEKDYKGRDRKGLDCSGFVGWVYWSVIGVKPSPSMSTSDIVPSLHLQRISFTDLKPGDIGMEDLPGASSNHIGYFVGFDENGRAKWAHSSSGAGGVTVNTTNCFRYYYRLFDD